MKPTVIQISSGKAVCIDSDTGNEFKEEKDPFVLEISAPDGRSVLSIQRLLDPAKQSYDQRLAA